MRDIFQDNETSRTVVLEHEFYHLSMVDFLNVSSYCQRLKELSDQLRQVGTTVSNDRLVLQLVSGLTPTYNTVGTFIRQTSPLPPFYQARSILTLEESDLTKQTTSTASTLVAASTLDVDNSPPGSVSSHMYHGGKSLKIATLAKNMVVEVAARVAVAEAVAVVEAVAAMVVPSRPPVSLHGARSGQTAVTGVLGSGNGLGLPLPALIQPTLLIGPGPI